MKHRLLVALGGVCVLVAGGVQAHHSYGMFDRDNEKTIQGVVQEFEWTNPHSRLMVLSTDAKGAPATWTIEIGPPGQLVRTGWKRNSVKRGDKIDVLINPLKDGSPGGRLLMVTLADGEKLYDVVFKKPGGGSGGPAGVGAGPASGAAGAGAGAETHP